MGMRRRVNQLVKDYSKATWPFLESTYYYYYTCDNCGDRCSDTYEDESEALDDAVTSWGAEQVDNTGEMMCSECAEDLVRCVVCEVQYWAGDDGMWCGYFGENICNLCTEDYHIEDHPQFENRDPDWGEECEDCGALVGPSVESQTWTVNNPLITREKEHA